MTCDRKHPLYEYVYESPQDPLVHTHRIVVKNRSLGFLPKWWFGVAMLLLLLVCTKVHWMFVASAAVAFVLRQRNRVEQEAVVVMPTLGIQLETVYRSKNVKRRFIPLHRILWPVINEAVTPTTCFTYLALLLRDDSRLTLTFLHVRPPLSMLVPIWSALCAAVGHRPPKSLLRNSSNSD
jgi:phosphatidylinositol glycan class H protein